MTPHWVLSHNKRRHSSCDLVTAVIAKSNEPPIKRMKRSVSLEASRLALHRDAGHEEGHIDVLCPSLRTENKGRRLSRGHEYTRQALNLSCDRKCQPHSVFGSRYLDSQGYSASGSAVSITLPTNGPLLRNEAIPCRQSATADGTYTEGSFCDPLRSRSPHKTASPRPYTKMADAYTPTYHQSYPYFSPVAGAPSSSNTYVAGPSYYASAPISGLHTEVPGTMSSSEYSRYWAAGAMPEVLMQQWPTDVSPIDSDTWDTVPENSPSTSSYYSFSPQVPPSLSRGSSSCSSSFPDPAYFSGSYQQELDVTAYTGFSQPNEYYSCGTVQGNDQLSTTMGLSSEMIVPSQLDLSSGKTLAQALPQQAEAITYLQTVPSQDALAAFIPPPSLPKPPTVQSAPVLHAPRPRRPYIPRWQCDPNIDLNQYMTVPNNPNNTPCQPVAGDGGLDTVMEESAELDDLTEEDEEFEGDHGELDSEEDGDMVEDVEDGDWAHPAPPIDQFAFTGTLDSGSLLFQSVSDSVKFACSA